MKITKTRHKLLAVAALGFLAMVGINAALILGERIRQGEWWGVFSLVVSLAFLAVVIYATLKETMP